MAFDGVDSLDGLDYGVVQPLVGVVRPENDEGRECVSFADPTPILGCLILGGVGAVVARRWGLQGLAGALSPGG